MNQQTKAYLYGLSAVLCWSTVATAFKLSLEHLSPAQLVLIASLVSTIVLFIIVLIQGQLASIKQLSSKQWFASLGFGLMNPAIYYLILFEAYKILPAQEAQAINYTWALTMALLAVPLLGQKLRLQDGIAALLCYIGVLTIATKGELLTLQFSNLDGVMLALLSTLLWALYWILNTKDKRPPVIGLFLNFIFALPFIILYYWWTEGNNPWPLAGVLPAIYSGIFEMGFTFVLWLNAMKLTNSTAKISNLIFLSPLLSLIFISSILGEKIISSTLIGLSLILFGLAIQQLRGRGAHT